MTSGMTYSFSGPTCSTRTTTTRAPMSRSTPRAHTCGGEGRAPTTAVVPAVLMLLVFIARPLIWRCSDVARQRSTRGTPKACAAPDRRKPGASPSVSSGVGSASAATTRYAVRGGARSDRQVTHADKVSRLVAWLGRSSCRGRTRLRRIRRRPLGRSLPTSEHRSARGSLTVGNRGRSAGRGDVHGAPTSTPRSARLTRLRQ